jgi:hypothetical protein
MGMSRVVDARIIFWAVEMLMEPLVFASEGFGRNTDTLLYSKIAGLNLSWMSQTLSRW